ncbi:hypothetical protein HU200_028108 [Digitaria exilis]|uniref:Uncharacterized protein n=1 Tax=Digitaria exilis TaxID=1010633 RepID=A0A835ET29_9POAL|nr:hypothetical protein HU200_028108 [Digitaria exilis]
MSMHGAKRPIISNTCGHVIQSSLPPAVSLVSPFPSLPSRARILHTSKAATPPTLARAHTFWRRDTRRPGRIEYIYAGQPEEEEEEEENEFLSCRREAWRRRLGVKKALALGTLVMEGRRDAAAGAAAAVVQGLRGEESGGGGVELSLRLRTGDGSSAPPAAAEEEREAAVKEAEARRRNMTIFYNGRVCAVDVTEVQFVFAAVSSTRHAKNDGSNTNNTGDGKGSLFDSDDRFWAIISMANEEMISAAAGHLQDSGSSSSGGMARSARDGHVVTPAAGSSRQAGFAGVAAAAAVIDQQAAVSELSMKRSLQRFLQKRKARTAGAVALPYAGARQAQAMRH